MPTLPPTTESPLVRTFFGPDSPAHWAALQGLLSEPQRQGFRPFLSYVDLASWSDATASELAHAALHPPSTDSSDSGAPLVAFIADAATLSDAGEAAGYPVLVVDVDAERIAAGEDARTTRCVARELWCPENNLSLANMDWEEWEESCEAEGGTYQGIDMDRHEEEVRRRQEEMEREGLEQPPPMMLGSMTADAPSTSEREGSPARPNGR